MTPQQAANTIRETLSVPALQQAHLLADVQAALAALKVLEDAANDWEQTARAESDGLMKMREQRDAAVARADTLTQALAALLDWAEKTKGGYVFSDPSEEWYATRDFARAVLAAATPDTQNTPEAQR